MSTREERWRLIDAAVAAAKRAVFNAITGADWVQAIRRGRVQKNAVREQIRAEIERRKVCGG